MISLAVPALRIFRALQAIQILRLARVTRGLRLVAVVGSLNRGMRTVRAFLGHHRLGYVISLSILVTFVGAAGMLAFEQDFPGSQGFGRYGDALWWTAMVMTTTGSQHWPQSPEGRLLAFLLALYAFAVFGYITAALASFFVGKR